MTDPRMTAERLGAEIRRALDQLLATYGAHLCPIAGATQAEMTEACNAFQSAWDSCCSVLTALQRERDEAVMQLEPLRQAATVATEERREIIKILNLEWDSHRGCYWLPAEPGPIECQTVPDAVRRSLTFTEVTR